MRRQPTLEVDHKFFAFFWKILRGNNSRHEASLQRLLCAQFLRKNQQSRGSHVPHCQRKRLSGIPLGN